MEDAAEKDVGIEFAQSKDASVWAQAFVEHKQRNGWTLEDIDESLMHGWFANAMMRMHDEVIDRAISAERKYCELREVLKVESLAAAQHEIWSRWMRFMFENCGGMVAKDGVVK